jgi:hypothetical protein
MKENRSTAVYEHLQTQFTVWVVLIINDHAVVVRNKTKIKAMSLYFKLCRSGKLNRLLGAFTSISFLTIIVHLLWPTFQNVCPMSSVKSDSTHHFVGNACTKSGSLRFSQFSVVKWFYLFVFLWVLPFPFGRLLGVR